MKTSISKPAYYAIALVGALFFTSIASAQISLVEQQPEVFDLLITWRAESLTPIWYEGRVLATRGSRVTAFVQAFQDDQPLSIADKTISWTINKIPVTSGVGKTSFPFTVDQFTGGGYNLGVKVFEDKNLLARSTIALPISTPIVVIDAPYPYRRLPRQNAAIQALLFFFNSAAGDDINLTWNINQREIPRENMFGAIIGVSFDSAGSNIPVLLSAKNALNEFERAKAITHISIE